MQTRSLSEFGSSCHMRVHHNVEDVESMEDAIDRQPDRLEVESEASQRASGADLDSRAALDAIGQE